MWKKKLKQKKQQFLLIALILMAATAIFTGSVSFTLETNKSSTTYFKQGNCPDLFYLMYGSNMENYLIQDENLKKKMDDIFYQPAKIINSNFVKNGKKLPRYCMAIMEMDNYKDLPWYMGMKEGNKKENKPGNNEIWVSSVYASDNNIHVGDLVSLGSSKTKKYKVSALFNSALCPSGMMGLYPFYMNHDTLESLEEQTGTYVAINFKEGLSAVECFRKELPKNYYQNILYDLDRNGMKISFSTASSLFGGIGTIAAFVIFIVSVVLIRFMLKSTLMREYRSIGIYKSLGFTSNEIKKFYLKCYLLTGGIALPLGVLLGVPFSYLLGSITFRFMGHYNISRITLFIGLAAVAILLIILILNVLLTLNDIKKITPVDALSIGMTSSKAKLKKSVIKNAYSPLSMAVNSIFKRKGMSFMIMLILMVSFYLSLFFISINYTCTNLDRNLDQWFGFPKFDCLIDAKVTDELKSYLQNSSYVKSVGFGDMSLGIQNLKCNDKDINFLNTAIISYDSFEDDVLNFNYTSGRPPKNPNEIGVSESQLRDFGLHVGDYIKLTVRDYTGEYLICGKFFSWYRGGKNIQILNSELDRCNVKYANQTSYIRLKDINQYQLFKRDLEAKFPNMEVNKISPPIKNAVKSIIDIASPITLILVAVFLLFSLLNIINLLLMNNMENRRRYGILKALGYTNYYICLENIYKFIILSGSAALLALLLNKTISGKIFYIVCNVNALESPLLLNLGTTFIIIGIILLTVLMFTLPLRKISPTELMEE